MTENQIKPSLWQSRVLEIPETWNVVLPGGRGGGKTYAAILIMIRHLVKYGEHAKILIVRENYKGLQQIEMTTVLALMQAFPDRVKFNSQDHMLKITGGGTIEFGQLEGPRDAGKYQGREATLLIFEESGLLKSWKWVSMLKSGLRSPAGVPLRTMFTANPGGDMHAHIYRTYIADVKPWHPFEVDGETWVTCPSTMLDNEHLDHEDYRKKLMAAYPNDPELQAAMISNSWAELRAGYFFGNVWTPSVHVLPFDLPFPINRNWRPMLSMDFGTAAPCITLFGGIAPSGIPGIVPGSWVVFDEVSTADMTDPNLNSSLSWPLSKICEAIHEKCHEHRIHAVGVADDAVGFLSQNDTLIAELRANNINMTKPKKGRVQALAKIFDLLSSAKNKDGKPGLYISQRCEYLIATIGIVLRDKKKRDDIETTGPDHGVDSLMYLVNSETPYLKVSHDNLTGIWPQDDGQPGAFANFYF